MFTIAKDGWSVINKIAMIFIFFLLLLFIQDYLTIIITSMAIIFGALTAFAFYFFRDPERKTPVGKDLIISPADGKIIKIEKVYDPDYRKEESMSISVFMNVFSVHVNRFPVSGKVEFIKYNPGKFMAAWNEKANTDNEHSVIGIDTGAHKVTFKQIAGLIARRIVYSCKIDDQAKKGDRFGLIKFGSRVDILVPLDTKINAKIGDWVTAGESVLGELPANNAEDGNKYLSV